MRKETEEVQKDITRGLIKLGDQFLFDSKDIPTQKPVAYIDSIPDFVNDLLDQLDRNKRLTWHGGAIPEEEIWLKIGGDHGGGSFKLMCQIATVENPVRTIPTSSQLSTAKTLPLNLRIVLNRYKQ